MLQDKSSKTPQIDNTKHDLLATSNSVIKINTLLFLSSFGPVFSIMGVQYWCSGLILWGRDSQTLGVHKMF